MYILCSSADKEPKDMVYKRKCTVYGKKKSIKLPNFSTICEHIFYFSYRSGVLLVRARIKLRETEEPNIFTPFGETSDHLVVRLRFLLFDGLGQRNPLYAFELRQ